jgi:hypothetical protein
MAKRLNPHAQGLIDAMKAQGACAKRNSPPRRPRDQGDGDPAQDPPEVRQRGPEKYEPGDAYEGDVAVATATPSTGLATTCLAGLQPRPVRWLVPGYIPLGKLVLIAGDGGHGKSSFTLDLAACLTTGRPCMGLDYPDPMTGEVLLVGCEDDHEDTVVPRLLSAGADRSKIYRVDGLRGPDDKPAPFNLSHFQQLKAELEHRPEVRLVVIDPAGAYIGRTGVDEHTDADLRALLDPLAKVAADRRVTVLLVKHLVKGATAKAVHKVSGSAAYCNAVRAAFLVAPSESDEVLKVFLPLKFNLGPRPKGISYQLAALEEWHRNAVLDLCPALQAEDREALGKQLFRLEWKGAVDTDANDLMAKAAQRHQGPNKVEQTVEWLKSFLNGYAWPDKEVEAAAKRAGFTVDNYQKAKARLRGADPRLNSSNRGIFQGAWWVGFGKREDWKLRPAKTGTPETPESPESPDNGESPAILPLRGLENGPPGPLCGDSGASGEWAAGEDEPRDLEQWFKDHNLHGPYGEDHP